MASSTTNVVRWSALIVGVTYGIFHQSTLQSKYDSEKASRLDMAQDDYADHEAVFSSPIINITTRPQRLLPFAQHGTSLGFPKQQLKNQFAHRAHLVEEAKKAYAAKKAVSSAGSTLITDIEDPNFDLMKVIESWTKDS